MMSRFELLAYVNGERMKMNFSENFSSLNVDHGWL